MPHSKRYCRRDERVGRSAQQNYASNKKAAQARKRQQLAKAGRKASRKHK